MADEKSWIVVVIVNFVISVAEGKSLSIRLMKFCHQIKIEL